MDLLRGDALRARFPVGTAEVGRQRMARWLVTGGAGFIGSHVEEGLRKTVRWQRAQPAADRFPNPGS